MFTMFMTTSLRLNINSLTFLPLSLLLRMAKPKIIENTKIAIIFSLLKIL